MHQISLLPAEENVPGGQGHTICDLQLQTSVPYEDERIPT